MRSIFILIVLALLPAANALLIESPVNKVYNDSVLVSITEINLSDLSYRVDNLSESCENCSELIGLLNLPDGFYSLLVSSVMGNDSTNTTVNFSVNTTVSEEPNATPIDQDFTFIVKSPQNQTYNESVEISIESNVTLHAFSMALDGAFELLCENCSSYNETRELNQGAYSFVAYGFLFEQEKSESRDFIIVHPESVIIDIEITNPEPKTYDVPLIDLKVRSVNMLDLIEIDEGAGFTEVCSACESYDALLNLTEGDYVIVARGWFGNASIQDSVSFSVNFTPVDYDSENKPHFDTGFEKLPQSVSAGELTEGELASIIRSNKLNPGIINRLIKTGKLGNESLSAIIETQKKPVGIFRKLLNFFGLGEQSTYIDDIEKDYNLSTSVKQSVLKSSNAKPIQVQKIQNEIAQKKIIKATKVVPPGLVKKGNGYEVLIENNKLGQVKKMTNNSLAKPNEKTPLAMVKVAGNDTSVNPSGKIPPGQAKKN